MSAGAAKEVAVCLADEIKRNARLGMPRLHLANTRSTVR
jgi:hypothetical protein